MEVIESLLNISRHNFSSLFFNSLYACHIAALCALTQCIPQTLRDKLESAGYSGHLNIQKIPSNQRARHKDQIFYKYK